MKRTSIFFPEPLMAAFREIAKKRDVPVATLIREAMEAWLKGQK